MDSMEQRVWERVTAQPAAEPGRLDIRPLMLAVLELTAAYRQLLGKVSGKPREAAQRLYEGELANLACLKGMALVSGCGTGKLAALPSNREPAVKMLEKCYHRTRRALMEYTARSAEPEFGVVFQAMAKREEAHCALIIQLLGDR